MTGWKAQSARQPLQEEDSGLSPIELENDYLAFAIDRETGRWACLLKDRPEYGLPAAGLFLRWSRAGERAAHRTPLRNLDLLPLDEPKAGGGSSNGVALICRLFDVQLSARMEFLLLEGDPCLRWRLSIFNAGDSDVRLDQASLLAAPGQERRPLIARQSSSPAELRMPPDDPAIAYVQGWQSWSHSGWLGREDRRPHSRLGRLTLPAHGGRAHSPDLGRGHFQSEMFGAVLSEREGVGLLIGFLSQREAFGHLLIDLRFGAPRVHLWCDLDHIPLAPGATVISDWACLQPIDSRQSRAFGPYLQAAAQENGARVPSRPMSGWCSWYAFFNDLHVSDLEANLDWLAGRRDSVPLDVFQIDDGYQRRVGDWRRQKEDFSGRMPALAERITSAGMLPGLWLAPFLAHPKADLLADHPDWVLRMPSGRPAPAGWIWNTFVRALDVTNPEVFAYVERLIRMLCEAWRFQYLKLDFLYAGALHGVRADPSLTRAQALHRALRMIRRAAGEKTVLVGCGCPIGSGIGIFDSMRVGPDVAPSWRPRYVFSSPLLRKDPVLPSVFNALQASLARSLFHRRWWLNDPDCVLLRNSQTRLSIEEVRTLATVASLCGGAIFDSDDLPRLEPDRARWLQQLIPPLEGRLAHLAYDRQHRVHAAIYELESVQETWKLLALFNWENRAADRDIVLEDFGVMSGAEHCLVDFWRAKIEWRRAASRWRAEIPAHGVRLFSLRPAGPGPQWLGDTLHISQGSAVKGWERGETSLKVSLNLGRGASGRVWLRLPGPASQAALDGSAIQWQDEGRGAIAMNLAFNGEASLFVEWDLNRR